MPIHDRYRVRLEQLDAVRVPVDEQVEEQEPVPPAPPFDEAAEREKANLRSAGGPV